MAQFDVFENPSPRSRLTIPFLIVLQHDLASETGSVVVAGLTPRTKAAGLAGSRLYPVLAIAGKDYFLMTPNMAALDRLQLKQRVANLETERRRIIDAIDILFTGV